MPPKGSGKPKGKRKSRGNSAKMQDAAAPQRQRTDGGGDDDAPAPHESGPGIYAPDRRNLARVQMQSIMLSGGSGLPRRACLERLTQAEDGELLTARLSADEHLRLVSTV